MAGSDESLDYSDEQLRSTYSVLNAQIGNLVSRISSHRMRGKISNLDESMRDPKLDEQLGGLREELERRMKKYDVVRGCEVILELIAAVRDARF